MTVDAAQRSGPEAVADLLRAHAGLAFSASRRQGLEAGLGVAMARAGESDVAAYVGRLHVDAGLLDDLISELTVGETYFLREPAQWEFVRHEIVPELRRRRGPDHAPRTWSAGCASGEEAYSLAIVTEEEGLAARATILATDISRTALARAEEASYGAWSLRGCPPAFKERYFRRRDGRYHLAPRFRRRVDFKFLNLALDSYPSLVTGTCGLDLVLCRNVLIYLDPGTVRRVARRLHESLAEGGWLITGPSDPPLADLAPFEAVITPAGVLYRRAGRTWSSVVATPTAREPIPEPAAPADEPIPAPPAATMPSVPPAPPAPDPLAEVRRAAAGGDHGRVVALTGALASDAEASALRVKALAALGREAEAEPAAAEAAARHPTSAELALLHGLVLIALERHGEAERALRRVLFLDRSLAVAHFVLATVLQHLGRPEAAARAYRNAHRLASAQAPDEIVPLADGERAGRLAQAAAAQREILEKRAEGVA